MYTLEYQKFLYSNYNLISINFNKLKDVNPFLQFYKEKIQEEKQYYYLENEFNKIKKELQEKCLKLNIPFLIETPCKEHSKDI